MPEEEAERTVAVSRMLVQAASLLHVPVLVTEQYPEGLGKTVVEIEEVLPKATKRFSKRVFSALALTELKGYFEGLSRHQIVIVGQETHVCVLQTVADLLQAQFCPFVVADGICSRNPEHKIYALERMQRAGAVITCGESVIFEWLGCADHPSFKEIIRLVND